VKAADTVDWQAEKARKEEERRAREQEAFEREQRELAQLQAQQVRVDPCGEAVEGRPMWGGCRGSTHVGRLSRVDPCGEAVEGRPMWGGCRGPTHVGRLSRADPCGEAVSGSLHFTLPALIITMLNCFFNINASIAKVF